MAEPVESIPNLGSAMAAALARAGIADAETLRALGADAAFARLIAAGDRPHFMAYLALVMGLMGRPWTDCRGAEKAALRARFDALVAGENRQGGAGIDRALAEIGVIPRR
jgi:hypothetical protein